MLCTAGEATARQNLNGAAHWHGPATVIGVHHESPWLAHRTTKVKCSKGHVRHATASEQLPLGPMLDALRAPPVLPGRDMQVSEDLFLDLTPHRRNTRPARSRPIPPIQMSLRRDSSNRQCSVAKNS